MKASHGNNNGGGPYENPEPGTYQAVCYKIVDLGTQKESYQGGPEKETPKVLLWWELSEKMTDGRPFSVFKEYTISLYETANLRKDIENWTGVTLTQPMIDKFNLNPSATMRGMLGKCCLLNIGKHATTGKTRVNGTSQLLKGMACPAPVNPPVFFDLADFKQDDFDKLPEWVQNKIIQSAEYQALQKLATPSADPAGAGDDIPF